MAALENLVRPSHRNRDRGPESKANHQQTAIPRPRVGFAASVGRQEKTGDLDANRYTEEERAVVVKAVREWGHQKNRNQIHLDKCQLGYYSYLARGRTIQIGAVNRLRSILVSLLFVPLIMTEA